MIIEAKGYKCQTCGSTGLISEFPTESFGDGGFDIYCVNEECTEPNNEVDDINIEIDIQEFVLRTNSSIVDVLHCIEHEIEECFGINRVISL